MAYSESPYGGAQTESQEDPMNNKQSSIFSLTLEEIQVKGGKSLGSMNMDEFLTDLWDDSQPNQTLTRQDSFSIPIKLRKKTVEEVWSEIQHHPFPNLEPPPQRQPTFGEITLEEFLIKAGVVQEPTPNKPSHNTCPSMGTNLLMNHGYAPYPIYNTTTAPNVENDEKSLEQAHDGPKANRKRIVDGPHHVVVERRQRRMIKNRESAARSRARKQAYTVELELELTQLKEENDKLKETVKELEQKQVQEILKRINKLQQPKLAREG